MARNNLRSQRYPINLQGPLCDLLDDEGFLFDVYAKSGARQSIKRFCRVCTWPGKPALSVSLGEARLKPLLKSLFNSPDARRLLLRKVNQGKIPGLLPLHEAIWRWLKSVDAGLFERLKKASHEKKDRLFLAPSSLSEMSQSIALESVGNQTVIRLARIVLAFCMLQEDDRYELLGSFLRHFPDSADLVGFEISEVSEPEVVDPVPQDGPKPTMDEVESVEGDQEQVREERRIGLPREAIDVLEIHKQYLAEKAEVMKALERLQDENLSDEEYHQCIGLLNSQRERKNDLMSRANDLAYGKSAAKRTKEIQKAVEGYPFEVQLPKVCHTISSPDPGESHGQWVVFVDNFALDIEDDGALLSQYEKMADSISEAKEEARKLGISHFSELDPAVGPVEFSDRVDAISHMLRGMEQITHELQEQIREARVRKERQEKLRSDFAMADIGAGPGMFRSLTIDDLQILLGSIDGDEEGDANLAGVLIYVLLLEDFEEGLAAIENVVSKARGDLSFVGRALANLPQETVLGVARADSNLARAVMLGVIKRGLTHPYFLPLDYYRRDIEHGALRESLGNVGRMIVKILECRDRRFIHSIRQLRGILSTQPVVSPDDASECEGELSKFISARPGQHGFYYRLRKLAWYRFFNTDALHKAIENKNREYLQSVIGKLADGNLMDIFRELASEITWARSGIIGDRHENVTKRYLLDGRERIEATLSSWRRVEGGQEESRREIHKIFNQLADNPKAEFLSLEWMANRVRMLIVQPDETESALEESDVGHAIRSEADVRKSEWMGEVTPSQPCSFAARITNEPVTISNYASDAIWARGQGVGCEGVLLEHYLCNLNCWVVREALTHFDTLNCPVEPSVRTKIMDACQSAETGFKDRAVTLREEALKSSDIAGDFDEYISEAEKAWEAEDRVEAEQWLSFAEASVREAAEQQQQMSSPEKSEMIRWLHAAGKDGNPDESLDTLRKRRTQTEEETRTLRCHLNRISAFRTKVGDSLPVGGQELIRVLDEGKRNLEVPVAWPRSESEADEIRQFLDEILSGLEGFFRVYEGLEKRTQEQLEAISHFLTTRLVTMVHEACSIGPFESELAELALNCPWMNGTIDDVFKALPKFGLRLLIPKAEETAEISKECVASVLPGQRRLEDLISKEHATDEPKRTFMELLRDMRFADLKQKAVYIWQQRIANGEAARREETSDETALFAYGISIICRGQLKAPHSIAECLDFVVDALPFLGIDKDVSKVLLTQVVWESFLTVDKSLAQAERWHGFSERKPDDPARRLLTEILLSESHRTYFRVLWGKGVTKTFPRLRPELLRFAATEERWDCLNWAIDYLAPSELQILLRNFLLVYQSDREKRPDRTANLSLLATRIKIQSKDLPSTVPFSPWVAFVSAIEYAESGDPVLRVEYDSPELERDKAGAWILRVTLVPRQVNYPSRVGVEISQNCEYVLADGEKSVTKQDLPWEHTPERNQELVLAFRPKSGEPAVGDSAFLSLRFFGSTITGDDFSVSSDLTTQFGAPEVFQGPGHYEIEEAYPGAAGNPVWGNTFFGREEEMRIIEGVVHSGNSIWVNGVRRIGKTSVLLETMQRFSFLNNRPIAVIYCPCESLNVRAGQPLNIAFMRKLRTHLLGHRRNMKLREWFEERGISRETLTRTVGEIEMNDGDLSHWIPELAEKLSLLSKNRLNRLVLLVDEVEKFESLWRNDLSDEVTELMGELRNVAQLSGNTSFIFAGSDLANRFITEYNQPFHGSIEPLPLRGFDSAKERKPARSVFLPRPIRDYFTLNDSVLSYAIEVCDGVPYFLSMLGKAVVQTASNRCITKSVIDMATKELMWGGERLIDRGLHFKFTKPLADLCSLGGAERLRAEIILLSLAKTTKISFPETSQAKVMKHAGFLYPNEDEDSWWQALGDCSKAGLVVRRGMNLRFRIPIMGEALRRMYDQEIGERIDQLKFCESDVSADAK